MKVQNSDAFEKLRSISQQHLLKYINKLSSYQLEQLLIQIASLNIPTFLAQQQLLYAPQPQSDKSFEPIQDQSTVGNFNDYQTGLKLISQGKVGCLIVAGGQGTRLKFEGPKGAFPISVVKNKSLFQLFAERVSAAGIRAGRILPIAIMTSPQNHQQTIDYFEKHSYFGLDREQVTFFPQQMLPMLDNGGNLFLEKSYEIAMGPDGNGCSLKHFYDTGIWDDWRKLGIEYLNFILIDNALADPFDAELIGYHHRLGGEATIKCTLRSDPNEKVGVLAKHGGKVEVVEYTELSDIEKYALDKNGVLKHTCANLSLFSFQMEFIKELARVQIPMHIAHKAVPMLSEKCEICTPSAPNAWKFEKFIFDVLSFAKQVNTLLYPREHCFAPLKNSHGESSPETVKMALQTRDSEIFSKITGIYPSQKPFELAQDFYYPTNDLLEKWKGKELPDLDYIEP